MTAAVIVIYNPNIELLKKNICSIVNQVDKIIICDNGHSSDIENPFKKIVNHHNIEVIDDGGNKGIAYALNRAVEYCITNKIEWLLTLDQDSVCPDNIINEYEKYSNGKGIAILTCAINYNGKELDADRFEDVTEVKECITSASYVNIEICHELGGFDEQMFIDKVDFEYCFRVKKAGYKILRVNNAILNHQLGDLEIKKVGNKIIHVGGHNSFRKYYIAQNTVYCYRKHADYCNFFNCSIQLIKLISKTLLYENNKIDKLKNIIKGIKSGKKMVLKDDTWIKVN